MYILYHRKPKYHTNIYHLDNLNSLLFQSSIMLESKIISESTLSKIVARLQDSQSKTKITYHAIEVRIYTYQTRNVTQMLSSCTIMIIWPLIHFAVRLTFITMLIDEGERGDSCSWVLSSTSYYWYGVNKSHLTAHPNRQLHPET